MKKTSIKINKKTKFICFLCSIFLFCVGFSSFIIGDESVSINLDFSNVSVYSIGEAIEVKQKLTNLAFTKTGFISGGKINKTANLSSIFTINLKYGYGFINSLKNNNELNITLTLIEESSVNIISSFGSDTSLDVFLSESANNVTTSSETNIVGNEMNSTITLQNLSSDIENIEVKINYFFDGSSINDFEKDFYPLLKENQIKFTLELGIDND